MSAYHLEQVNVARMRAPLDDARMAGFVNNLEPINALPRRALGSSGACKPTPRR